MSYFKAFGLPEPVAEHRFHPVRRWRFDFAWIDQKVAVEVNGGVWVGGRHTRGAGFLGDMQKLNEAQKLGWSVYQFTPQQMRSGEAANFLRAIFGLEN